LCFAPVNCITRDTKSTSPRQMRFRLDVRVQISNIRLEQKLEFFDMPKCPSYPHIPSPRARHAVSSCQMSQPEKPNLKRNASEKEKKRKKKKPPPDRRHADMYSTGPRASVSLRVGQQRKIPGLRLPCIASSAIKKHPSSTPPLLSTSHPYGPIKRQNRSNSSKGPATIHRR
jgi:hypothetical protein